MDVVCLREETSKTVVAMYQARCERLSRELLGRLWLLSSLRETVISHLDETREGKTGISSQWCLCRSLFQQKTNKDTIRGQMSLVVSTMTF